LSVSRALRMSCLRTSCPSAGSPFRPRWRRGPGRR
jgi:hypothetical protein